MDTSSSVNTTVYVYLLNEGVDCWRPVPAVKVNDSIYILQGFDIYDPDDEEWEFPPGTRVLVEEKEFFDGKSNYKKLAAIAKEYSK
jgi:hypothetical protein